MFKNNFGATYFGTTSTTNDPTRHVASCGICCVKIHVGTPLHQPQLVMWQVVTFVVPKGVALDLLNVQT